MKKFLTMLLSIVCVFVSYIGNDIQTTNFSAAALGNNQAYATNVKGDSNNDGTLNVRDAAYIAQKLAKGTASQLPSKADYNGDGTVNVRDAAAIAKHLATVNPPATTTKPAKVYYTKTGKCYHYSNTCNGGTYYECTLAEALAKGLEPCGKCVH